MTNYSKLQNLTKDDINIINNEFFIKDVKLGGPFIDIFFGNNSGLNNDHKKTILSYFLTSKDLISVISYDKNTTEYKVFFKKLLQPIKVQHDPEKDEFFTVFYDFRSLLNLQAHTFKHCIADYWKNRGSAPDFIEENEEYFNKFWNKFREIDCKFFLDIKLSDIDTRKKAKIVFDNRRNKSINGSFEKIKKIRKETKIKLDGLKKLKIITDEFDEQNWCMDCINKHNGSDTFLKCWKLFSGNNIHESYLKKIRTCIVETIQDQKNIELYKGNTTKGTPERRHIHYREDGNLYIASYALDYKSNKDCHIFYLLLKKRGNRYNLLTAYPYTISKNPETKVHSHADKELGNMKILNCCHTSNWTGVKKLLCGN